jgi:hypothetical protein
MQDLTAQSMLGLARAKAGDLDGARSALATAIELSQRAYPHVDKAAGLPIIAGATLLEAAGDPAAAFEMYEDAMALMLHIRSELMFHYVRRTYSRLRKELGREHRNLAPRRTEAELVEATREIARAETQPPR